MVVSVFISATLTEAGSAVDDRRVDLVLALVAVSDGGAKLDGSFDAEGVVLVDVRRGVFLGPGVAAVGAGVFVVGLGPGVAAVGAGVFVAGDNVARISSLCRARAIAACAAAFFAALESSMLVEVGMVRRKAGRLILD